VNAAGGQPKPTADAETHTERSSRTADTVGLGAFVRARGPVPHGTKALGRWFLERHKFSLTEALGAVLVRLAQLEERKGRDQ